MDLDNPLFPWMHLSRSPADSPKSSLEEYWTDLAERYVRHQRWRSDFNEENFTPAGDFARSDLSGWHADGLGLEGVATPSGDFAIAPKGGSAMAGLFPAGTYTHLLSEKLNGAIRSPYLPRDRKYLSLRVLGGKLAAWRTVLDNCMLSERYDPLDQERLGWIKIPLRHKNHEFRIYAELVTKHNNPRLPDRPDRWPDGLEAQMEEPRSYFGVTKAVLHDCDELPEESLEYLQALFESESPRDIGAVADRYAAVAEQAVDRWGRGAASDNDVRWLQWLIDSGFVTNSKYLTPGLRRLVDRYRTIERRLAVPRVIQGMSDLEAGRDVPIFVSGNPRDHGETVPRGYLSLLDGSREPSQAEGSGRREMAEQIASARNPLTARVMVNRIWHHLFGRGLVPTVDNLGRFGERPSHPELLDHLAMQFVNDGWSIKSMIRTIVLSQAFRQSSVARPEARAEDPGNELLHRFPVRRLDAEAIRDSILLASGKLDRTMYGPSIHPYREKPKAYRKLLSGPLDGNARRSIYLKVTRHEGSGFLEALDFPAPAAARGRRDVTNVPHQALTLMNDPFVLGEAEHWARALISETSESSGARLRTMYRAALGRLPTVDETDRMEALAGQIAEMHGEPRSGLMDSVKVWKDVAHSILNLKEFIYIQ